MVAGLGIKQNVLGGRRFGGRANLSIENAGYRLGDSDRIEENVVYRRVVKLSIEN